MRKAHVITIFDKNYLARTMAFRESMQAHAPECQVWFLLLDDEAYEMTKKLSLPNTTLVKVEELDDAELMQSKSNRTMPEFASTTKPAFMLHMMRSGVVQKDDLLAFIDPDFFLYTSPKALFEKIYDSGSITITPHRFPPEKDGEKLIKGVYNAGMVCMRNDTEALKCLEEWRRQCIEWCYIRFEDGKIGDQGYLSEWPKKYHGVFELVDKGVNLSTWNIENYKVTGNNKDGFLIDGEPLIFYHFHGLKIYTSIYGKVQAYPITVCHRGIYRPYISALQRAYSKLQSVDHLWTYGTAVRPGFLRLGKQAIMKLLR